MDTEPTEPKKNWCRKEGTGTPLFDIGLDLKRQTTTKKNGNLQDMLPTSRYQLLEHI